MFGLGNLVRGIFGRKDDEEDKRSNQNQGKYQSFDATKLSNVQSGQNNSPRPTTPEQQKPLDLFKPSQPAPQSFSLNAGQKSVIDKGLDAGQSWEDIARNSGVGLEGVRRYSQATRPDYGIEQPSQPKPTPKPLDFREDVRSWGGADARSESHQKARVELTTAIKDTRGDWSKQHKLLADNAPEGALRAATEEILATQNRQRIADLALGEYGKVQLSQFQDKTPGQILQEFNVMDAGKQRDIINILQKNIADYSTNAGTGNKRYQEIHDQSQLVLAMLQDRGSRKESAGTRARAVGGFVGDMAKGFTAPFTTVGRSVQSVAGQDGFEALRKEFAAGNISEDEFVRSINRMAATISEQTGGLEDRGIGDRLLRSAGTSLDVTSSVVPVGSFAKGVVKGLAPAVNRQMLERGLISETAKRSTPDLLRREAAINAALGAGGSLREGTDWTPEQALQEAAMGGALGATATAAGAGAGRAIDIIGQHKQRDVYRGAPAGSPATFVTENRALAEEFARDTEGILTKYNMQNKDVLDVSRSDHYDQVQQMIGKEAADRLLNKTPSQVFSPDDEALAREIARRLGFKAVKFDERLPGRDDPPIAQKPFSIGVLDESALTYPLSHQERGFVRISKSAGEDLSPEQRVFVNDYAEMLESMDADANGGQMIPDGEGGYKRTTEHSQFYSNAFSQQGRPPTKQQWFDEARRQLESGRAAYGAGEDYAKLPGLSLQGTGAVLPPDARAAAGEVAGSANAGRTQPLQGRPAPIEQVAEKVDAYPDSNTTVSKAVENGQPQTVVTEKMADGSEIVTKANDATGVSTTSRVIPDEARQPGVVGSSRAAEGYFDPTAERKTSGIVHISAEENAADISRMGIDAAIQAELRAPGADIDATVRRLMERTGMERADAVARVNEVAQMSRLDIRDGYPTRASDTNDTPLESMSAGPATTPETMQALRAATEQLKAQSQKGLAGRENAIVFKESRNQKLYAYMDGNGEMRTFILMRRPDGSWSKPYDNPAPIRAADDMKNSMRLLDDAQMQKEVERATNDGQTRQYIWQEGENGATETLTKGRKDPVTPTAMPFDPAEHYVSGGFVRSKIDDQIVGNYVAVGPNGIEVQIGRNFVTFDLDFSKMNDDTTSRFKSGGGNNSFNQTERWIESITKDQETRAKLRNLLVYPTRDAEAAMKVEARAIGDGILEWEKAFKRVPRKSGSYRHMMRDSVHVIEPPDKLVRSVGRQQAKREMFDSFRDTYGDEAANMLNSYGSWLREGYDNMLERMNTVRRQFGLDEVPHREDYITHSSEIGGDLQQLYQSMREGIFGEIEGASRRGGLPANIAGLSDQFEPITKWNKYAKQREGDQKPLNPFDPLRQYSAVTLHNIHMTAPAARTRSLQQALRAADTYIGELPKDLEPEVFQAMTAKLGGNHSHMTSWLKEHANILSGKTAQFDRQLLEFEGGATALKFLRWAQRQAGQANILGNMSSALAQTLNFPNTIGTNGLFATMRGIRRSLMDGSEKGIWRKSSFMIERYTDGSRLGKNTKLAAALKPLGIPLKVVERAFGHIAWNASYEKALASGLTGNAAIRAADTTTTKVLAGRSIGDTAHVYNNATTNAPLQFTREVTEAWKNFTKDQTPYGKALALVAALMMNEGMKAVTGREPLPDPLGALADTVHDFRESDDSIATKAGRAGQRAAETVVSAVPLLSAGFNAGPSNVREGLFGEDSDLGRYEGTMALFNVPSNTVKAVSAAIKGDWRAAAENAVAMLPGGSQMRKTSQAAEVLDQGYADNAAGNIQTPVVSTPTNIVKGLAFGRGALDEQKAYYESSTNPMSGDQTKVYKELLKTDPAKASEYHSMIHAKRELDKLSKQAKGGDPTALQTLRDMDNGGGAEVAGLALDVQVGLLNGTYTKDNGGVIRTKDGDVARSVYKKLAQASNEQSDEAYQAYLLGYNLKQKGSGNPTTGGNPKTDALAKLSARTEESDIIKQAINLQKSDNYADVPAWVKERYAADNGIDSEQLAYATQASYTVDVKSRYLDDVTRDMNNEQLYAVLAEGRKKSIGGDYFVTESMLKQLYDAERITKDQYDWLRYLQMDSSGNVVSDQTTRRRGKVKGLAVPDYRITLPKLSSPWDFGQAPAVSIGNRTATKNIVKGVKAPEKIKVTHEPLPTPRVVK